MRLEAWTCNNGRDQRWQVVYNKLLSRSTGFNYRLVSPIPFYSSALILLYHISNLNSWHPYEVFSHQSVHFLRCTLLQLLHCNDCMLTSLLPWMLFKICHLKHCWLSAGLCLHQAILISDLTQTKGARCLDPN